jgi:hypothetical protein
VGSDPREYLPDVESVVASLIFIFKPAILNAEKSQTLRFNTLHASTFGLLI